MSGTIHYQLSGLLKGSRPEGKGTGAALEKQFYVTLDEKCLIIESLSSLAFCPFLFK